MTIRGCNRPRIRAVGLSGAIATFGGQSFWNACQVFVSGQPSLASQKRTLAHDLKRSGYIDEWFASIVKPKSFYEKHARIDVPDDGTRTSTTRCYFYNIDLQGRLFLEETLPKNIATSIKDNRFLDFFFTRLKHISRSDREWMVAHDISVDDYPFISICGREFNFIRPAASPIVFHSLVDTNERQNLVFGGYSLVQPFDEVAGMAISEQTGRLYHKLTSHILKPRSGVPNATDSGRQEYGLIRSTVAVSLSERIVAMNENDAGNSGETTTHSGFGFGTSSRKLLPLPWLPTDSEPGPWAMPFTDDE